MPSVILISSAPPSDDDAFSTTSSLVPTFDSMSTLLVRAFRYARAEFWGPEADAGAAWNHSSVVDALSVIF